MAITPVHSGYTVLAGTTTGKNSAKVDTWIEYKVIQDDRSIEDNTSTINVYLYARANTAGLSTKWTTSARYGSLTIAGTTYQGAIMSGGYNFTSTSIANEFAQKTNLVIAHNTDGTKSITLSGTWNKGGSDSEWVTGGNVSSKTITIPTIPRASTFTCPATVTAGSSMTVTISRASNNFTHFVTYTIGNNSHTVEGVATSNSYTIPASWVASVNTTSATITVTTYSNGTAIGSTSKTITVNAPSGNPSIGSMTVTEAGGIIPSSWNFVDEYVNGKSKLSVNLSNVSASSGSSITSYSINAAGYSGTGTNLNSLPFVTSGFIKGNETANTTAKVKATVTDGRGRTSAQQEKTITIYAYRNPWFTSLSCYRSNAQGTAADDGQNIAITAVADKSSCNGKNSVALKYRYHREGQEWPDQYTSLTSGTQTIVGNNALSLQYGYEVEIVATDALGSSAREVIGVPTAERLININSSGSGLAIGGFSNISGALQVKYPSYFEDGLSVNGYDMLHSLLYRSDLTSADDIDTLYGKYNQGYYYINGSTPINSPFTSSTVWTILVVIGSTGGYTQQFFVDNRGGANPFIWMRQRSGNPQHWGSWVGAPRYDSLFYKSGETSSPNSYIAHGYLSESGKRMRFQVELAKKRNNVTTSLSTLKINAYGSAGYCIGTSYISGGKDVLNDSAYTVTVDPISDFIVRIQIDRTTAFNGTNNTPIIVELNSVTFLFS